MDYILLMGFIQGLKFQFSRKSAEYVFPNIRLSDKSGWCMEGETKQAALKDPSPIHCRTCQPGATLELSRWRYLLLGSYLQKIIRLIVWWIMGLAPTWNQNSSFYIALHSNLTTWLQNISGGLKCMSKTSRDGNLSERKSAGGPTTSQRACATEAGA